jgi:glycosyltransferase involved in cell wall biosynthesis
MNKLPITLTVITKNEAERVPFTLQSVVGLVDEIIVIDSGSTDETIEIAKQFGAKVFTREWTGYGPQKIYAETLAKNKWILNLDADESLTPDLKEEIRNLFKLGEPEKVAYNMNRYLVFIGQKKASLFVKEGKMLRLYNKEKAGFRDSRVHDSVVLKDQSGKIGELKNKAIHRCFKSYYHWIEKMNDYTQEQALDWVERGRKKPSALRLIFEPIFAFLKSLFIKRYITLGIDGLIASYLYATAKLLRLCKVRETYQKNRARTCVKSF